MTGPRPDRPVTVPQIACVVDGGCYNVPGGSPAAKALGAMPALYKPHAEPPEPVTVGDVARLLLAASRLAIDAGWVNQRGVWRCPRHAQTSGDTEPRRFTVRECLRRHRTAGTG